MAVFDLNYTPNHTKLGSSVNVKHFFLSPLRSALARRALQGTCSTDEGGNLQFLNVLWRPERCPVPPPERDQIHPQLSQDLICAPPARPVPSRPTSKLARASSLRLHVRQRINYQPPMAGPG